MLRTSLFFMKSLSKTEIPIFYLQYVLCFQRQPFRFLFKINSVARAQPLTDMIWPCGWSDLTLIDKTDS